MKEIKFRGKRKDNGKWVFGSLVNSLYKREDTGEPVTHIVTTDNCDSCFNTCDNDEEYFTCEDCFVEVDPATVGQYTGLKDKHGREIYDGDICNCREYECYGKVAWNDDEAGFYFCISYEDGTFEEERLYDYADALEIIGNIHDNPELLDVDMSNEIEHEYTDMIVCPWCGHSDRDSWKTEPGLWECDNCKKSYYVERNEEVTYSTQKANYGTCKHCGKENVPVEDYLYGDIGSYKNLCPDCGDKEWRRMLKEY
jgi:uncharacterized phage protein (TIGR01671 family)